MIDKKFILSISGKEFIKFEGLLSLFHENGGKEIYTKIINTEPLIIQATVKGERGTYQGIGDADDNNVGKMILPHKIRMAETRAIARALRFYNNIGMCSAEELGEGEEKKAISYINILRVTLRNAGAKNEKEAIELIESTSGVRIKKLEDITNERAKVILEDFNN